MHPGDCAPHLITAFALTERAVAPARLAEATAWAASALVAGQAAALALSGRLAEAHGPDGAFAVAVAAAAAALALALATRAPDSRGRTPAPPAPSPAAPQAAAPVPYAGR
ncbi:MULTISPECIES: hypothetical protein [Streptomyces]|uniref:hypothetical protein n=1 Tax=Streptomyces TaxID=1883 RepID=UPI0026CF44FD